MIIQAASRLQELKEYYFSIKLKEVRTLQEAGHDVINLGIGSPDLAPSPQTVQALVDTARQANTHGYQPYKGVAALRKAIAGWYESTYGVNLDPENEILPLIGSKEGITHISLAFLDPGDEVLIPELGYPSYRSVSEMVGAVARTYPLLENKGWQPDWQTMEQQDYSKVKIMWVNYPHMPTGAAASRALFEQLVAFAKKHQILLCHDNPYSLILNEEDPLSILAIAGAREVCLELNSMSKSHNMAGWRVGWISGEKDYIDTILKVKSNVDSGMFLGLQQAAIKALDNTAEWHREQNEIYKRRRLLAEKIVEALQCSFNPRQTGMFIWARVPDSLKSVEKLVDSLLYEQHIFLTPGFIFGQKGERYIRISLCTQEALLEKALERIKNTDISAI
jgi:LL-diaminopimelate aminotransferase